MAGTPERISGRHGPRRLTGQVCIVVTLAMFMVFAVAANAADGIRGDISPVQKYRAAQLTPSELSTPATSEVTVSSSDAIPVRRSVAEADHNLSYDPVPVERGLAIEYVRPITSDDFYEMVVSDHNLSCDPVPVERGLAIEYVRPITSDDFYEMVASEHNLATPNVIEEPVISIASGPARMSTKFETNLFY